MKITALLTLMLALAIALPAAAQEEEAMPKKVTMDDFTKLVKERQEEWQAIEDQCRLHDLADDYFLRFSRDPDAEPADGEVVVDESWKILLNPGANPVIERMAGHLVEFMDRCMNVSLQVEESSEGAANGNRRAIILQRGDGVSSSVPESFAHFVTDNFILVEGKDVAGVRDGIVRLMDRMALRQAPFVEIGNTVYEPRIPTRLSWLPASHAYVTLMGYNAILPWAGSLYSVSRSDAIPELAERCVEGEFEKLVESVREAAEYGLKTYLHLGTMEKFPADDPVLLAHPEIRGTMTWREGGDYTICTEHPLVKQYLQESVGAIFEAVPELDGIQIIIGGEGFYHCFMRPHGTEKGHTNCPRCEAIGPDKVVANLCNYLAEAAREHNPDATVLAWPYSAVAVWSEDKYQTGFIQNLKPGTGITTEVVKDEVAVKEDGLQKVLWDYSIDMIGPGDRARVQAELCREQGIPINVLSMAEGTFEGSLLPGIPAMDRWVARAAAMADMGPDVAFIWQIGPFHGMPSIEAYKLMNWSPAPEPDVLVQQLADRIAGDEAGPYLREAWKHSSEAVTWVPEIGQYYFGPHYLGPAHPMIADVSATVPDVFYGYYLFYVEMTPEDALKGRPTFRTTPSGENPEQFARYYDQMRSLLKDAVAELDKIGGNVPERTRLIYDAEANCIRWFYHTARTCSNFQHAVLLRDELNALMESGDLTAGQRTAAQYQYNDWLARLQDERENTRDALDLARADCRFDFYYRGDHSFPHMVDMLEAKLKLLDREIQNFLPSVATRLGLDEKGE